MQWEHRLPGMQHNSWFAPISLTTNGEFCAASAGEGGVCRIWRLVDGRWRRQADLDAPPVSAIAAGDLDGTPVFAIGHHGGDIAVIEPQTLEVNRLGRFFQYTVRSLIWLASENAIAARGSDDFEGSVCVVEISGRIRWRRKRFVPNEIQASPGVVFCLEDHGFVQFDATTGTLLSETELDGASFAHEGALLPDGRVLFIAFDDPWQTHLGGRLRLWRGESAGTVDLAEDATAIGLCPNGDCIVGFDSGHLGLFHGDRVERIESWRPHFAGVNQISVCPGGQFATSSSDARVGLWRNLAGDFHGEPDGGVEWRGPVSATCVRDTDICLGFPDGTVGCLDQADGGERWTVKFEMRVCGICAWQDDLVVTGDDGSAWIVTRGQSTARLPFRLPDPGEILCSDDQLFALSASGELTCVLLRDARFDSTTCAVVDGPSTMTALGRPGWIAVGHKATVRIYQVAPEMKAKLVREIVLPEQVSTPITRLFASDGGTLFAAVGNMASICLVALNVDSGESRIMSLAATDIGSFSLVDYCPDSRFLATAINCDVYGWFVSGDADDYQGVLIAAQDDIEDRPPVLASHRGPVTHLRIVGGSSVMSVGQDGRVQCNPFRW